MVDKTGEGNDERARYAFTMKVYDLIRDDRHKEAMALIEKGRKKFKEMVFSCMGLRTVLSSWS